MGEYSRMFKFGKHEKEKFSKKMNQITPSLYFPVSAGFWIEDQ